MVPWAKDWYQKAPFENHCLVGSVMTNATLQIARLALRENKTQQFVHHFAVV